MPVFALANAGVALSGDAIADAMTSRVTLGVAVGLVAGKTLGILGALWPACRTGVADLPGDVAWRQIAGIAALGGIGFTVSLFVTCLAFGDARLADDATVGILIALLVASALGATLLRTPRSDAGRRKDPPLQPRDPGSRRAERCTRRLPLTAVSGVMSGGGRD